MNHKKDLLLVIFIVAIVCYVSAINVVLDHEMKHYNKYAEFGIKSYITIDWTLHGHTYPINPDCVVNDCVLIGKEQDKIDGVFS